jgi:hypothetical protein
VYKDQEVARCVTVNSVAVAVAGVTLGTLTPDRPPDKPALAGMTLPL